MTIDIASNIADIIILQGIQALGLVLPLVGSITSANGVGSSIVAIVVWAH